MATTPRGKANEQAGKNDVLKVFRKAGVSRAELARDARRQAKAPKGGRS